MEVQNSGTVNTEVDDANTPEELNPATPCSSKESNVMFKKKRLQPLSKSENILQEIKMGHKMQEDHFMFLRQHLERSEKQRDRFLDILENAFSSRKRKRDVESSDTD